MPELKGGFKAYCTEENNSTMGLHDFLRHAPAHACNNILSLDESEPFSPLDSPVPNDGKYCQVGICLSKKISLQKHFSEELAPILSAPSSSTYLCH